MTIFRSGLPAELKRKNVWGLCPNFPRFGICPLGLAYATPFSLYALTVWVDSEGYLCNISALFDLESYRAIPRPAQGRFGF